jgi:hypothetical protein
LNEHIGFVLSALAKTKLQTLVHPRILIFGTRYLYYFLEGLFLHQVIDLLPFESTRKIFLEDIIVFDQTIEDDQYLRIKNEEQLNGLLELYTFYPAPEIRKLYNKCNVGIWRGAFSLMHPCIAKKYSNPIVAVPLIKEDPYQYLIDFMKDWHPDLVVFLYEFQVNLMTGLKLIEWYRRWNVLDFQAKPNSLQSEMANPEIIVALPKKTLQSEVLSLLNNDFSLIHGVYNPFESCGRELGLMEVMIFDLVKQKRRQTTP